MLSDDRFLFSDGEGQSALRLHSAVGAGRCCAFYLKGVMEEITGVSPVTAVNSGQVSTQEDRELSQRPPSPTSTLASLPLFFFPFIPLVNTGGGHIELVSLRLTCSLLCWCG